MLKASELRIGNFIIDENGNIAKIRLINPFKKKKDKWSGIPLTPEILEKCGFEKREVTEDGVIYGKTKYTLIYAVSTDGLQHFFLNGYHNDVQIDYLHHLQNIYLDFTGNELEIEL